MRLQPGAESEEAIRFCGENGIAAIHRACILTELGDRGGTGLK